MAAPGECDEFPEPLVGGYCLHVPASGPSGDIVYYLHGGGGSEFFWDDEWYYTRQIRKEWRETGAVVPVVVSVSFGRQWLLAEKNASQLSGLLEVFRDQVMPAVEERIKRSRAWKYYELRDPDAVLESVRDVVRLARAFYPSSQDWALADPLQLALLKRPFYPSLYVAVGFYDRFAAYEGNEAFGG